MGESFSFLTSCHAQLRVALCISAIAPVQVGWSRSRANWLSSNETIDDSSIVPKESVEPVKAPEKTNGNGLEGFDSILDLEDNNDDLSPPPDSPIEPEPLTRGSSVPANLLEDEIVVGTNVNQHSASKPSPLRAASETEDLEMDDVGDETLASQKRKRASTWLDPAEVEEVYSPAPTDVTDGRTRAPRAPKGHGSGGVKGTLLGYWRDSQASDPKDKHAVIGFIDIRDRLRTRIQPTTRDGRNIIHEHPLPPGPGGSWVTFQQVAFDPHLVYLNQHQVKEYVKIRVETQQKDETLEQRAEADAAAVKLAIDRLTENPPPPAATEPLVAYGAEIPEGAQPQSRPEAKKRKLTTTVPLNLSQASHQPLDSLPGTRPTRILLGYWRNSSEPNTADKHAVYGILGANDMFRVKLMRETRDGRPLQGNFPMGAGALWIHWDEVEFEPHLIHLTRPEIKEYCRVRQSQLDRGERPVNRPENESLAVAEAQHRVATTLAMGPAPKREDYNTSAPPPIAMKTSLQHPQLANGAGTPDHRRFGATTPESLDDGGPRNARHALPHAPRGRHSLPDVELRAANRPPSALERTNSLARREIARVEAASQRAEVRSLARDPYHQQSPQPYPLAPPSMQQHQQHPHQQPHLHHLNGPNTNRAEFDDHVSRLNKVWAVQEASRLKVGAEDAKIYMGVKYERKQNGPFEGKLVSQGTIISIDGEDFVEYRVLTKPTFF